MENNVIYTPTAGLTDAEKLSERQKNGTELLNMYLLDNDALAKQWGRPFTVAETAQQAQKFQLVMSLLPLGSLKQCLEIITGTATDSIFTQERKDKYISALNNYIAAQ